MTLTRKIFNRLAHSSALMASALRYFGLMYIEGRHLAQLTMAPRNRFSVPIRCGGRGVLEIGSNNSFGYRPAPMLGDGHILLQPRATSSRVKIGDRNAFSNNVVIVAMGDISVGDRCQIGDRVSIYDCDFHEIDPEKRNQGVGPILPVKIGNNVWLGSRVMILKGVSIGDDSVIGAGSIVTQQIPPGCVAVGVPAKVVQKCRK